MARIIRQGKPVELRATYECSSCNSTVEFEKADISSDIRELQKARKKKGK